MKPFSLQDQQDIAKAEKHKVVIQIGVENNQNSKPIIEENINSTTKNDPIEMLKNRPKRSSLKQSCSQGRKVGRTDHQAKTSIGEVSSDEEELISDFQLISNVFHNRRKSCNSWRGRQRERAKGGSVSSESEVFEIIHMEENNDEEAEVTSLDKFITGMCHENDMYETELW